MSIVIKCATCGLKLQAPDSIVGKRVRCSGCKATWTVPNQEVKEPESFVESRQQFAPSPPSSRRSSAPQGDEDEKPAESAVDRKPCPVCGEMIAVGAAKCRFCGEIFDPTVKRMKRKKRRGVGGDRPLASRFARLGAALLDGVIATILLVPGYAIMLMAAPDGTVRQGGSGTVVLGLAVLGAGGLFLVVVQCVLLSTQGQTMGKKAVGVRIVKMDDGDNPGFVSAVLLRGVVPGFIGGIPCLGGLFTLVDILCIFGEERRCLHDQIAGTIVVEA